MIPGRPKPSGPRLEQHITPRARATSPRRRAWGRAAVPCTVGRRNGRDPDTLCARPMAECSLQPVAMAICQPGRCRYSQVRNVQPRSRLSTEVGANRRFYAVNVCTSGSLVAAAPRNAVADPDQRGWLTNVRFNRELSLRAHNPALFPLDAHASLRLSTRDTKPSAAYPPQTQRSAQETTMLVESRVRRPQP